MNEIEKRARELLAAELDAIRFPSMAAEVRDETGYNSCGAAMVRAVTAAIASQQLEVSALPDLPFSPYLVSEWTGPEMIDRKTWTAYSADQMYAYAAAAVSAQQPQGVPLASKVNGALEVMALAEKWRHDRHSDPHTDAWTLGYIRAKRECANEMEAALAAAPSPDPQP